MPPTRTRRSTWAVRLLVGPVLLALASVTAIGVASGAPQISLYASPSVVKVTAGGAQTSVAVLLHRDQVAGKAYFSVAGLPHGVDHKFSPKSTTGDTTQLAISATNQATPGQYPFQVDVFLDGSLAEADLTLVVAPNPQPQPFQISGTATGLLSPGTGAPIDLELTNPDGMGIDVTALTVQVTSVSAPQATAEFPCSTADYSATQYSGTYPLLIPANSHRTLDQLGVAAAKYPTVQMINAATNQNGCKGATVSLTYTGTAQEAP